VPTRQEATEVKTDDLLRVVGRFCTQLRREGYRVEHELVGDVHLISAYEPDGQAVARYIACPAKEGVSIEEVPD
jgi:hypothetical protein